MFILWYQFDGWFIQFEFTDIYTKYWCNWLVSITNRHLTFWFWHRVVHIVWHRTFNLGWTFLAWRVIVYVLPFTFSRTREGAVGRGRLRLANHPINTLLILFAVVSHTNRPSLGVSSIVAHPLTDAWCTHKQSEMWVISRLRFIHTITLLLPCILA